MSGCVGSNGWAANHGAGGYLISPEGERNSAMCREHADRVIAEYRDKLGEEWWFDPLAAAQTPQAAISEAAS